ncbi:EAL domain-containing protein [Luteimonas sp. SDU101]|uniref:EAL domain-containing protein n=1 Tax=Luteimonas sp. SDU101 TaxID=3422593 RepID=UPI003EB75510
MSDANNRQRAEVPPAGFWRRWCADAAPAVMPRAEAVASGDLTPAPVQPPADSRREAAAYRVLVVEDDPSQALFAESVLNGAGMEARVVSVTSEVMDAMRELRPDLVLMDLHMPGLDGVELTGLIRSHPDYALTPVVFLTGDEDPERRFEVLDVGADDFLRKPVRPRHLVSAVQSRILRARMLQAASGGGTRHPATGLLSRPQMLQMLAAGVPGARSGAAVFVEIAGTAALRDRYGYAALEALLTEAGRRLGEVSGGHAASRLNDNTFLVFATGVEGAALPPLARQLRDGLGEHPFNIGEERVRLRAVVGYAELALGFEDAGAALSAAEEALRAARGHPHGVAAWARPVSADDRELSAIEQSLREALASGSLLAAFQPIVAVAGGDEAQYQVLLRLRGAGGELYPAGRVLQAANRIGSTLQVDRRMAEIAIGALRRQQEERRPLRLFVTQAPSTLAHDGHAQWLVQSLAEAGVDGASLVIDVRQDDALVHALSLQEFCADMVVAGVQLCLSQYRHGPEANALLGQLPLGYVRLDPRYSRNLDETSVRDEMRSAIDFAHRMGLQVIGQQVEDAQSAATLWMTGVDYIQGNLVQRPAGDLQFDFHTSVL